MPKQPPPAPIASAIGPCPTNSQIRRTPRHWKFTQHLCTTRPPHFSVRKMMIGSLKTSLILSRMSERRARGSSRFRGAQNLGYWLESTVCSFRWLPRQRYRSHHSGSIERWQSNCIVQRVVDQFKGALERPRTYTCMATENPGVGRKGSRNWCNLWGRCRPGENPQKSNHPVGHHQGGHIWQHTG